MMRKAKSAKQKTTAVPAYFKPILWSYDFSRLDADRDKQIIIINAVNYGALEHLRWIRHHYGAREVQNTLAHTPSTEFRPQALRLVSLLFHEDR